jgi:hypothetical protein
MAKIAVCNLETFKNITSFSQITESIIREKLSNIKFHQINNTLDFYKKINEIIYSQSPDCLIEIANCYYDDKILIQAFYTDNVNSQILVKRKINENDSYTFMDYKHNIEDPYHFLDITFDDIINLIVRQHSYIGVLSRSNLEEETVELLINKTSDIIGTMEIKNGEKIKYLDMAHWIKENNYDNENNENSEEISEKIEEELNKFIYNNGILYLYSKHTSEIGSFNCINPITSNEKNHKLSNILNHDIFGDCYIWLEENSSESQENMILRLDVDLFNKIAHNKCNMNKRKNKLFYNIYYEGNA